MSYEPDPGSLDAETFKPLHFKVDEDDQWRVMAESEVLEAYRGSTVPSSTLFRRGDDGIPRTLATLIKWNGRECPFADFSEPEKREEGREKIRRHSGSGDAVIDENQNCVESREKEGEREDQQAVFTRFISYMDQIQDRMTSIEKVHTEQHNLLAGAELFMKKVASLELRADTLEKVVKAVNFRTRDLYDFVFFSKRAPIGQSGQPSTMHAAQMDDMFETAKKMNAEAMQRSEDLDMYKEEVQKAHSLGIDLTQKIEVLDDRYGQLIAMLAANERNVDVREAIEEWNEKQKQKKEREEEEKSVAVSRIPSLLSTVPLPRKSSVLSTVSKAEKLDWNSVKEGAMRDNLHQAMLKQLKKMENQEMADHIYSLLSGRERPAFDGDLQASASTVNQLQQLGIDLRGAETAKLSAIMEDPRFICFCGANVQSGATLICHSNSSKHVAKRMKPLYQSDVNYWISIIIALKPRRY